MVSQLQNSYNSYQIVNKKMNKIVQLFITVYSRNVLHETLTRSSQRIFNPMRYTGYYILQDRAKLRIACYYFVVFLFSGNNVLHNSQKIKIEQNNSKHNVRLQFNLNGTLQISELFMFSDYLHPSFRIRTKICCYMYIYILLYFG